MTCIIDTRSKRHLSAKLMAGLAISAFLVLGTFVASASAQHRGDQRGGDRGEHRGWEYRGDRGHPGWGGGYYSRPPVVYGSPYYERPYYPPPVVYGPGIGIYVPGVSVGIY
jgi:hypothetical protein